MARMVVQTPIQLFLLQGEVESFQQTQLDRRAIGDPHMGELVLHEPAAPLGHARRNMVDHHQRSLGRRPRSRTSVSNRSRTRTKDDLPSFCAPCAELTTSDSPLALRLSPPDPGPWTLDFPPLCHSGPASAKVSSARRRSVRRCSRDSVPTTRLVTARLRRTKGMASWGDR